MTKKHPPASETYRKHFANPDEAYCYEAGEYGEGSYSWLLWQLEQEVLVDIVRRFRESRNNITYLDFASGTGRIVTFMEEKVDDSTSIEISEAMAEVAKSKLHKTHVLCADITSPGANHEGVYDLITAFRFFLNAEPSLRKAAMRQLALRLRDESSQLIFNNHGNLWSIKILAWPLHRILRKRSGWVPKGNYLRHAEIVELLDQSDLKIVRQEGVGFLGGSICNKLPSGVALMIEKALSYGLLARFFGQSIVYVVSKKTQKPLTLIDAEAV